MDFLKKLSAEERRLLYDAVPYITLLVAGADDHIDAKELATAERIANVRSYRFNEEIRPFYQVVDQQLKTRLEELLRTLPESKEERQAEIGKQLAQLNDILPKLNRHYAHVLYDSFVSFAKHIAEASGGVIGYFRIDKEEKKVIDLPMIKPVNE